MKEVGLFCHLLPLSASCASKLQFLSFTDGANTIPMRSGPVNEFKLHYYDNDCDL